MSLLNRFATRHQDEIVDATDQFDLDDSWVTRFKEYAVGEGFDYRSPTTQQAESVADLAAFEDASSVVRDLAGEIVEQSRQIDQDQFNEHRDYIKRRLKQIAIERHSGSFLAYKKAVVSSRPDIRFAAALLKTPHE